MAFFGLGLVVMVLFALFYELTTSFNIHRELQEGNQAVGVVLGANMVAIGLVVFKATFGDFVGWGYSMLEFGIFAGVGFVLLLVIRLLTDLAVMPGTRMGARVAQGNTGVAFVEATVVVCTALVLLFAI